MSTISKPIVLFDNKLEENNFYGLENSLNKNHRACVISCMGKFRTGKSTILNIIIKHLSKDKPSQINFIEGEMTYGIYNHLSKSYLINPVKVDFDTFLVDDIYKFTYRKYQILEVVNYIFF